MLRALSFRFRRRAALRADAARVPGCCRRCCQLFARHFTRRYHFISRCHFINYFHFLTPFFISLITDYFIDCRHYAAAAAAVSAAFLRLSRDSTAA